MKREIEYKKEMRGGNSFTHVYEYYMKACFINLSNSENTGTKTL